MIGARQSLAMATGRSMPEWLLEALGEIGMELFADIFLDLFVGGISDGISRGWSALRAML